MCALVFQVLIAGRPIVTRDGRGIRELIYANAMGVELLPPADPKALLAAVERVLDAAPYPADLHADVRKRFSLDALAQRWDKILKETIAS